LPAKKQTSRPEKSPETVKHKLNMIRKKQTDQDNGTAAYSAHFWHRRFIFIGFTGLFIDSKG
jgi:hypothetical protein